MPFEQVDWKSSMIGPKRVCVGGTSRNAKTCLKQVMQLVGNQGDFWLNYVKMR